MSLGKFLLLWTVGILLTVNAFAQSITVKGNVTDNTGMSVIGANVLVKGTTNGTITDIDGNFTLQAQKGDIITVSFIGYTTQEQPAAELMKFVLSDDTELLEEVVVIGYGSVKKSDLSGSVVAVKAEEINRGAVTSPQELMQGKVPGLYVNTTSGEPGAGSTIRIRSGASLNASNDPLIVIDGIPTSNDAAPGTSNALATINPNDIETFTVLKDASATAIYGSRASNGVIIITTKKGSQGKVKVTYNSTYTAKDAYKRVDNLSATELRNELGKLYAPESSEGKYIADILNQYPEQETNWQDAIFQTGLSTDQNLSIAGTAAKVLPFRVSFGYNTEKGTLKTSKYDRYTGSINLSPKFFQDHLSVDINVKGSITDTRFADSGAIGAAAFFDPTKPIYSDDSHSFNGYWNWASEAGAPNTQAGTNPLSLLYDRNNQGTTKRSLGNIQLDYKIHGFEDLRANLNLGYDVAETNGDNFVKEGSFMAAKDGNFPGIGSGNTWNNLRRNHVLDFYLNYVKDIESIKSHIDVMAGYSWQHFYYKNLSLSQSNPMDPSTNTINGWTYNETARRYFKDGEYAAPYENYLVSFFGRLNYNLMDRYLLTATLRRDGSSRFSENNRWGMFPSVALAWSIINENFMESTRNVLSNLKLRLGYGITGQQEIGDYMYLTTYKFNSNPNSTYLGYYLLKPQGYSPDLKWEQTTTYNLGLDFGFLNNRISGTIEYYQKHTKDLLNTISAPAGTNFTNEITANVGEMKNEGVEFNINAVAVQTKDFTWQLGYNITWNSSKITKLTIGYNPDYPGINAGSASYDNGAVLQKHQVGSAPSTFWLYKQVYNEDGTPMQNTFVDLNGDGQITEADRYMTDKSPMPKIFMGLSSQFTYKNWDLGFNLRANFGNYVYNAFAAENSTIGNINTSMGFLTNYDSSIYTTGFKAISNNMQRTSDYFLENASFLKLDNLTLGYSFDKFITEKLSGRISFSVQNVFTVTNYTGLDPECAAIDQNLWPQSRTYTLGLNLNF